MRKKIIVLISFLILALGNVSFAQTGDFADIFSFGDIIAGLTGDIEAMKEELGKQLSFLGDYTAYALQTGHFAPTDAAFLNVGVTANIAFIGLPQIVQDNLPPEAALLKDMGMLPMGFAFAGLNIPFLPVKAYLRGLFLPAGILPAFEDNVIIVGLGAALDLPLPLPFISVNVLGNYHFMTGIKMINLNSIGVIGTAAFSIPVIDLFAKPYISVGWSLSTINVAFNLLTIYGANDIADLETELAAAGMAQADIDAIKAEIGAAAQFDITYNYALNFPISVGVRISPIPLLKLTVEYTNTLAEIFSLEGGAISISFALGL